MRRKTDSLAGGVMVDCWRKLVALIGNTRATHTKASGLYATSESGRGEEDGAHCLTRTPAVASKVQMQRFVRKEA
eukprot:2267981-Pleurochrysis_carterae.AAC.2